MTEYVLDLTQEPTIDLQAIPLQARGYHTLRITEAQHHTLSQWLSTNPHQQTPTPGPNIHWQGITIEVLKQGASVPERAE